MHPDSQNADSTGVYTKYIYIYICIKSMLQNFLIPSRGKKKHTGPAMKEKPPVEGAIISYYFRLDEIGSGRSQRPR